MFPDPNSDTLVIAKAWFQSHAASGTTVVSVIRADNATTRSWITYYKTEDPFPAPSRNNCSEVKRRFQKSYQPDGIVKVVSIVEREDGSLVWSVQSIKKVTTCWDYVKSAVFKRKEEQDSKGCAPVLKVKIQRKESVIFVEPKDVQEDDLPKRLYLGKDVTRRFTGRRSLNRRLFSAIKDRLINNEDCEQIRHFVTSLLHRPEVVHFVAASKEDDIEDSQDLCNEESTEEEVESKDCMALLLSRPRTYAAVAYDYSSAARMYQMSKLQDSRTFALVRRYISSCIGFQGYGKVPIMRPEISEIELANAVAAAGLPLDESLKALYLEYCSSRGITRDAERELLDYALKERNRLKRFA